MYSSGPEHRRRGGVEGQTIRSRGEGGAGGPPSGTTGEPDSLGPLVIDEGGLRTGLGRKLFRSRLAGVHEADAQRVALQFVEAERLLNLAVLGGPREVDRLRALRHVDREGPFPDVLVPRLVDVLVVLDRQAEVGFF